MGTQEDLFGIALAIVGGMAAAAILSGLLDNSEPGSTVTRLGSKQSSHLPRCVKFSKRFPIKGWFRLPVIHRTRTTALIEWATFKLPNLRK